MTSTQLIATTPQVVGFYCKGRPSSVKNGPYGHFRRVETLIIQRLPKWAFFTPQLVDQPSGAGMGDYWTVSMFDNELKPQKFEGFDEIYQQMTGTQLIATTP